MVPSSIMPGLPTHLVFSSLALLGTKSSPSLSLERTMGRPFRGGGAACRLMERIDKLEVSEDRQLSLLTRLPYWTCLGGTRSSNRREWVN